MEGSQKEVSLPVINFNLMLKSVSQCTADQLKKLEIKETTGNSLQYNIYEECSFFDNLIFTLNNAKIFSGNQLLLYIQRHLM